MNPLNHMMLLQLRNIEGFYREDDPVQAMIILAGIGGIIIISIIINLIRRAMGTPAARQPTGTPRYSGIAFRRLTSSYGLDRDQSKLLESIFRANGVGDPARVLRNSELVDRHFERAYKAIERSSENDEAIQQKLLQLFSLRNTLESSPSPSNTITTTNQIAADTPAVLSSGRDSYTVRVISSKGQTLITEYPRSSLGTSIKIPKGARVSLSFFTQSSKGFSFDSRVIGSTDSIRGPALELAHSGRPKPLAQRRFRRKETNIKCSFQMVFVESSKTNRKDPPKLSLDPRRFNGTILDLSAGGCSLKTPAPVQIGSRLKIEVAYTDGAMLAVLGQVLRTNRNTGVGTVVHVKFLKVPRRSLNNINALVFGYD